MKKLTPYLVIIGVSFLGIVIYKAVVKQFVPASIQAYLP